MVQDKILRMVYVCDFVFTMLFYDISQILPMLSSRLYKAGSNKCSKRCKHRVELSRASCCGR